jgi:acetyltransferase-like isoleucine patch superfamily enzyme
MELQNNYRMHQSCKFYGINKLGRDCTIMDNVTLGFPSARIIQEARLKNISIDNYSFVGSTIGDNSIIRSRAIIYCDVVAGERFKTGHNAVIREMTRIGNNVLVGTNSVIDGNVSIGSNVSIQSNVYIPTNTVIEDHVFLGPCSVLTNDKYPIRVKYELKGPILRKGASIGANSTILPGIEIGEGAMVAAGALVTKDVPPWKLAIGFPARIVELPAWTKNFNVI